MITNCDLQTKNMSSNGIFAWQKYFFELKKQFFTLNPTLYSERMDKKLILFRNHNFNI